ncbi:MAG: linear amide C-N hydrolase, partial [Campylobacteraceae bacterium]|nr:linear amide C-N hydrolase [Campylobacteraceae bacterium]
KNIKKTRYLSSSEPAISWTSKYGSITFNQYGKEFPAGGMNDRGLVVEILLMPNTRYPNEDKRKEVDILGWVQYQLDTSSSIYDVIESDKKLRITSKPMALIHFLITDAKGNSLVVEYINGEAVFFHGKNLKYSFLTNTRYKDSSAYLNVHEGFGGERKIDYEEFKTSEQRFILLGDMINKYKPNKETSIIDYSFETLNQVKNNEYTQFQIVYDIKNKKMYFRSKKSSRVKSLDLQSFDFENTSKNLMFDINTPLAGNINNKFLNFDYYKNKKSALKAFRETKENLKWTEDMFLKSFELNTKTYIE